MSSASDKARLVAAVVALIALSAAFLQMGFAYSTSVQASASISAESMAIDITDGTFNTGAAFSTDEITAQYDAFTTEVVSTSGAADTVVRVTVTDRSTISSYDLVKFRVSSTIQGVKHSAGFVLSMSTTGDDIPMITAADGEIVTGSIGAATGSGQYQFDLKVTGMKSQASAKASAAVTQYVLKGATANVATIGGTDYAGRAIGSSTLEVVDSTIADQELDVTLSTNGFADLGDSGWRYILSLTCVGKAAQYAYSTDGSTWNYSGDDCLILEKDVPYTAALYLAGIQASGSSTTIYAWNDIPSDDGTVISGGTITFAHSNA